MPRDVADDLTPAGGMTDHGCIFEIEMVHQLGKILGVLIHVVALPGLARASMAAAIVGDNPIASLSEKQHLGIPGVGAQRPSMREGDNRSRSPVFVVDR